MDRDTQLLNTSHEAIEKAAEIFLQCLKYREVDLTKIHTSKQLHDFDGNCFMVTFETRLVDSI